jgi:predicted RNA-binding Zn ribbon-like protein
MSLAAAISEHDLLGGRLALDFVNTIEPRTGEGQRDFLPDYRALAAWSAHSGAVTADEAAGLLLAASADARRSTKVWRQAIEMREALYRLVLASAEGRPPLSQDLVVLTRASADAQRHAMLTADDGKIRWCWDSPRDLERPLWEVTRSGIEILTTDDASRLGVCRRGADGCGWVFFDATKNRSRRWCGMADCGTRAKARRLTERRRRARAEPELPPRSAARPRRAPEPP